MLLQMCGCVCGWVSVNLFAVSKNGTQSAKQSDRVSLTGSILFFSLRQRQQAGQQKQQSLDDLKGQSLQ